MPVTVIKVRYESSLYNYTSLASASRDIFATEGIRGFFGGWGATAIRDAPYAGLYVLFYEQAKKSLSGLYDGGKGMDDNMAMVVNAAAGAGAAAAATAVTNPFDALKTRIQVNPEKYRNMWTAAKIVCTEEAGRRWRGRALFDGLGLRVARKAVSSALAWGLYERMVR
jgi:solute carrier family 25 protein 38